ncbi:hypothetical protein GGS26DRAFT_471212 [Hypomontagnella submonticulosa]|nr:hypothetical protein GGS26DRAFT_471212 [Hypomontagnella submonticulosa]
MVGPRAITATGCSHCRLAVLKLFASSTGSISVLPPVRARTLQCRPQLISPASLRPFSSRPIQSEPNNIESAEKSLDESNTAVPQEHEGDAEESNSSANIPWYLQVEPPRHVASIEPPPLPEVPSGSPAIIGSLLEYVSEDLGLDELSLLDLRELDPPAALGPNLFMLFGTARSERHLNVSAGRLLRWLRAKHRVYAHADGLLGPNERKTKLRRKAKRAKLLGGTEDADDGIKTGWICVNLGTIGSSREESAVVAEDGRAAGFGVAQNGSTIVVQIMTEFRRAEMGLENLWKQAQGQPVEKTPESDTEQLQEPHPLEKAILSSSHPPTISRGGHFNNTSRRTPFEQTRSYSTEQEIVNEPRNHDSLSRIDTLWELQRVLGYQPREKYQFLKMLQVYLDKLPSDSVQQVLGISHQGVQVMTPFLRLFRMACRALPPHQTWEFRLDFHARACELNKKGTIMTVDDVQQLVDEMCLHGIEATRQQLLRLLNCIYGSKSGGLAEQAKLSLQILQTMEQRGQMILANDIIVTIIGAAARSPERTESQALIRRLEDVLLYAGLPCMDEPLIKRLMSAYIRLRNWDGFWDAWRIPPRYLRPRSAGMYVHVYKLAAETRSPGICAKTLRRCFQEMLIEDPPVPFTGEVTSAIMECICIADPHAEAIARSISPDTPATSRRFKREFVKMIRSIQLMSKSGV